MLGEWLRKHFAWKEIGWHEYGETFYRYAIWRTCWFNLYLHQLDSPQWHPQCHDHPWSFLTLLVWRGYVERTPNYTKRRYPGMILYRPATFTHAVQTPQGMSWSLVLTTAKSRDWGFKPCERTV